MNRDQKFFDIMSIVLGVLVLVALLIYVTASRISAATQDVFVADSAEYKENLRSNLQPIGDVYLPGDDIVADRPVMQVAETVAPEAAPLSGPQVYNEACIICHGAGVGGAPKLGDAADWGPRLANGTDTLYMHAIQGFTGSKGFMPAKGGRVDLSDDEVRASVDHMIEQSGAQ